MPTLSVGDYVRVQNQTTNRTTKWDKTGRVVEDLVNRQYEIMMDGSRRITLRNRQHLRRIPGKYVVIEEGEEEAKSEEQRVLRPQVPAPAVPAMGKKPASPTVPSPAV